MKKKKIAFVVSIIIVVLSLLCFIWAAYTAENYRQMLQSIKNDIYYNEYFTEYLIWFSLYVCVAIFNLIIVFCATLLFILYKNDFTFSKEEREIKEHQRKQKKKEKLQKKLDDISN